MEKKRGLGKGLDALLGNNYSSKEDIDVRIGEQVVRGGIFEIDVEKIVANPQQPRTDFNEDKLEELKDSIRSHGIIQPITLRRIDRNQYQIISGERRFKAAKAVGLQFIPAFIREANDNQMFEMALVENLQREDLNAIEVALSYQKLMDDFGLSLENIATKVGKKRTTISNVLRLLKLPDNLQFSLKQKEISTGHARALINLENDSDKEAILKKIIADGLSVRQVEQIVRNINNNIEKKPKVEALVLPENIQKLQRTLKSKYYTNFDIKRNHKGQGSVKFNFLSDEMLEDFLKKLL
ncbi:MAG: hypothetical protein AUJ98_07410 [Bacteroidetes bacterium CG2_30_33_31]|nr:MAG: hypothetical protein AUJ98_07410 [Bacteroidetes bacterium CG2_30_33_31]